MSTEPCEALSSLLKEQQLNENVITPAHRPHEVTHVREGEMEEMAEEEEEEVRGEKKGVQRSELTFWVWGPSFNFYYVPSFFLFLLEVIFTIYFFSYHRVN